MIAFLLVIRNLMAVVAYGALIVMLVLNTKSIVMRNKDLSSIKRLRKISDPLTVEAKVIERSDVELVKHQKNKENVLLLSYDVNGQNYRKELSLYNSSGFYPGAKIEIICSRSDPTLAALKEYDAEQDIKALIHMDIARIIIAVILFAIFALVYGVKISWEV